MKAERLYYRDAAMRAFDAQVIGVEPVAGRFHVRLDRTAFYPNSGGQPSDTGVLDGVRVADVFEDESGDVVHVLEKAPRTGAVHGEIDWVRRFDHIQQHTGQHLLSAVFVELFKMATVSFHLGEDLSTIDLDAAALSDDQMRRAEARANEIVFENRPVRVTFTTKEAAGKLGLRKDVNREGEIRLIEIENLDLSACGGTHVSATGQIGAILLRRCEKVKQGMRVEFVCGGRAVTSARRDYQALVAAANVFTAHPHELPQLIAKKIEEAKAADKERRKLLDMLAGYESQELHRHATPDARGLRSVEKIFDSADAGFLRYLASQVTQYPGVRVTLVLRKPPTLMVAQSKGLPEAQGGADLGAIFKKLADLGLRGGGSRDSAQAGAPDDISLDRALERLREELP